jgi:hypothetical protein
MGALVQDKLAQCNVNINKNVEDLSMLVPVLMHIYKYYYIFSKNLVLNIYKIIYGFDS